MSQITGYHYDEFMPNAAQKLAPLKQFRRLKKHLHVYYAHSIGFKLDVASVHHSPENRVAYGKACLA